MNLKTPLVGIPVARVLLGLNADEVLSLIQSGKLALAWDIARQGGARAEVRIYSRSLQEFLTTGKSTPPEISVVTEKIFPPHYSPNVINVAKLLAASTELVRGHIADGELAILPGDRMRRGRGGSPRIVRQTLTSFLVKRVYCA